jgi:hypothetical protein
MGEGVAAQPPFKIIVHFPEEEAKTGLAQDLPEALSRYFAERAGVLRRTSFLQKGPTTTISNPRARTSMKSLRASSMRTARGFRTPL